MQLTIRVTECALMGFELVIPDLVDVDYSLKWLITRRASWNSILYCLMFFLLFESVYICKDISFLYNYWSRLCMLFFFSSQVTITNIIPVIIVVVCFPFPFLHGFLVTFIFCFTGLQIVMKMLFQLDIVSDIDHANVIASGAPSNPLQPKSSVSYQKNISNILIYVTATRFGFFNVDNFTSSKWNWQVDWTGCGWGFSKIYHGE